MLINHFCDTRTDSECSIRRDLRSQRRLSYGLFDFDFSIILPPGTDLAECRLSYERSWGTFCRVYDTAQGEFDYNPFVFDVGNMGVVFCDLYQVGFLTPRMLTSYLFLIFLIEFDAGCSLSCTSVG